MGVETGVLDCEADCGGDCAAMWQSIQKGGKHPFLINPERHFSYALLGKSVRRWLWLFDEAGMVEGERVLIRTGNEFAAISCFIAALLDGKVPVNLSPDTPAARLHAIVQSVEPKCLVHDGNTSVADGPIGVHQMSTNAGQKPNGLMSGFASKSAELPTGLPPHQSARSPALPTDRDSLAYLVFTSGTTSQPIGVQITRRNLFANLATITRLFGYNQHSRIFNDMMLAHADGMIQGPVLALANRGAVVRAGGFTLARMEEWLGQIRACRATHVVTVPTIWSMIDAYAAHSDYFDAPECKSLQSVAANLPASLWERLETRFDMPMANHYGLTETVASALYAGPHPEMGGSGTIGRSVDCEARVDPGSPDPASPDSASPGPPSPDQGELQLRGTNIFPGYWRNDARNADSFTQDGWLKTGDLVSHDGNGSFRILGRLKNIIMSGGFLIRPDEIDETMLGHAAVRESVTVALDDQAFGEIAASAIVLDGDATLESLFAHARSGLEPQKVPRLIRILAEIPRGLSGKPKLAEIRQELQDDEASEQENGAAATSSQAAILALAGDVFRVPAAMLTLRSGPDDVAGWDSFSHLSLIMEAEKCFAITISAARIAGITRLGDLHAIVAEQAV